MDSQLLGGERCGEEIAGEIAHDEYDEVTVYTKHIFVVAEIPFSKIEKSHGGTCAVDVDLGGCEDSVCSEDHGSDYADEKSLAVSPAAEQTAYV